MKINCGAFAKEAENFLRKEMEARGLKRVVIGVSGGLDSAVVATLAVRALGRENVIVVFLPNGTAGEEAIRHGMLLTNQLGLSPLKFDIAPTVRDFIFMLGVDDPVRSGNIAARCRMIVLMDAAKAAGDALVLGTENKTEHELAYFTIGGDEVSNLELIRDLYKTQVRQLAEFLDVPEEIQKRAPTADLWAGQTDEDELGVSYEMADKVLAGLEAGWAQEEFKANGVCCAAVALVQERKEAIVFKIEPVPYPRL